ncbi:MAG: two-component system, NtrC family, sensor kinase [Clostridiales bacterium]|nr:two-component system, NtrC family, sensor kinase [Clostridiales bacterium]
MSMQLITQMDVLPKEAQANQKEAILKYAKEKKIEFILEDIPEIMSETQEGVQRIERIVKSLLGFSRTSQSQEWMEYDLNKGVQDTLTIANNEIKYYAKAVTRLGKVDLIRANAGEINQVILNLLVNASYAIKSKNEPLDQNCIKISTTSDTKYAYLEIEDTGSGIPDSIKERIFEPFFTTKPVGTGTGLGLSIAHDIIVNKHKGQLQVESKRGIGTKFIIMLPY